MKIENKIISDIGSSPESQQKVNELELSKGIKIPGRAKRLNS